MQQLKEAMIELFYPYVPEDVKLEVMETLHSRWVGQGPKCNRFEKEFEKTSKDYWNELLRGVNKVI